MIPAEQYPDGPYRPEHWPEWARDEIFTDVTVHFGWTDRLLILIGRAVTVNVRMVVARPPGRIASKSSVWAHRIRWPWTRQPGGYSEMAAGDGGGAARGGTGMSRSVNEDNDWSESRQAIWDNAVNRATYSKRGQKVLRELEAALLALPTPQLIEGLLCDGTGVCAVGALAAHRTVLAGSTWAEAFAALDESGDDPDDDYHSVDDTADFAKERLKMAFALAWDLAYDNDHRYGHLSPEDRYIRILGWVRDRLKTPVPPRLERQG